MPHPHPTSHTRAHGPGHKLSIGEKTRMSNDLLEHLAPIAAHLATLDLAAPDAALASLRARFSAAQMAAVSDALRAAHATGALTPQRATPTLTFGRLARPAEATSEHSVDAVDIEGAGAPHTHPRGEVSWCVPLEGAPVFEGASEGWVVLPPGSHHTPTVTGGRMLIVYFLPGGKLTWGAAA